MNAALSTAAWLSYASGACLDTIRVGRRDSSGRRRLADERIEEGSSTPSPSRSIHRRVFDRCALRVTAVGSDLVLALVDEAGVITQLTDELVVLDVEVSVNPTI